MLSVQDIARVEPVLFTVHQSGFEATSHDVPVVEMFMSFIPPVDGKRAAVGLAVNLIAGAVDVREVVVELVVVGLAGVGLAGVTFLLITKLVV